MRYERPMITRRERIEGLLAPLTSIASDAARKENVVPVAW